MINDQYLQKTLKLYEKNKNKENIGSFFNILQNIFWIIFGGLVFAITCISTGIFSFVIGISEYGNLDEAIIGYIKMFFDMFLENDIYLKLLLIMFILSLLISIVKTITNPRVKEKYRNILCYGYGTRITLIKKFDNEISLNKRFKSLLYIYELNKNKIDSLIEVER